MQIKLILSKSIIMIPLENVGQGFLTPHCTFCALNIDVRKVLGTLEELDPC